LRAIQGDEEELPGQLHGRLLGSTSEAVRALLAEAIDSTSGPWLRPIAFALYPAGLQLLRAVAVDPAMNLLAISESGQVVLLGSSRSRAGLLGVCDFERDGEAAALEAWGPVFAIAISRDGKLGGGVVGRGGHRDLGS
jgi:hypothetical protein